MLYVPNHFPSKGGKPKQSDSNVIGKKRRMRVIAAASRITMPI